LEIICFCPTCGASNRIAGPAASAPAVAAAAAACRSCRAELPLDGSVAMEHGEFVTRCPVCGEDKLFVQKRLSQKVGCLVIAVGAALVPWTYGLSLAACALLDLILYKLLPTITVCYVCAARIGGVRANPDHHPYDLMTAQTWEARSVNWRRRNDRSGA
jgi:hypothetical protein